MSSKGTEDDVVTLLWERNFEFIDYMVVKDLSPANPDNPVRKAIDTPFLQADRTAGESVEFDQVELTPPVAIPVNTVTFTDEEIEKLRGEIEVEDQDLLLGGIFDVMLELVFREMGSAEGDRFADTVKRMLETLYENGQFRHLAALIRRLHELAKGPFSSSPSVNRLERDTVLLFASREKAQALTQILNLRYHGGINDVIVYLTTLPSQAAPHLIAILPDVVHLSYRRALCEAISKIGRDQAGEIGARIDDPRPYVVRDAVYILGRIDDPTAVEYLSRTIRHTDREIRLESVVALSHYRGPNVEQLLMNTLLDPDVDTRTAALGNIVSMGSTRVNDEARTFLKAAAATQTGIVREKAIEALRTLGLRDDEIG